MRTVLLIAFLVATGCGSTTTRTVEETELNLRTLPKIGEQIRGPLPETRIRILAASSQMYPSYKVTNGGVVYTLGLDRQGVTRYLATSDPKFATPEGVRAGWSLAELLQTFGGTVAYEQGFAHFVRLPSGWNASFEYGTSIEEPEKAKVSWFFQR